MYRKLIESMFLTISLILIFTACGGSSSSSSSSSFAPESVVEPVKLSMQTFFEVTSGETLNYQVPNGSAIKEFTLIGAPSFVSVDENSSVILAVPTDGDIGDHFFQAEIVQASQPAVVYDIKLAVYMKYTDLLSGLESAPSLIVEDLLSPVSTNDTAEQAIVPNTNGIDWNILKPYRKKYWENESLVMIDSASGDINTLHIPESNTYNWKFLHSTIANNKLVISGQAKIPDPDGANQFATKWTTRIHVYDPATNSTSLNAIKLPAEMVPSSHFIEKGMNGKLYGTGLYDANTNLLACYEIDMDAYEADPVNYVAKDFGPVGVAQEILGAQALGIFADETHVYLTEGTKPYYLIAINIATGVQTTLLETTVEDGFITLQGSAYGAIVQGKNLVNDISDGDYFLYNGELIAPPAGVRIENATPPWPGDNYVYATKVDEIGLSDKPEIEYFQAERGIAEKRIWYRPSALIGTAGLTPEEAGWRKFEFTSDVFPQNIQRLDLLPNGKFFGAAVSYGGMFIYDEGQNSSSFAGQYGLSHYSTTVVDDLVYVSGYPNGPLYEFNTSKPINRDGYNFNTSNGTFEPILGSDKSAELNPRFIGHLESVAGIHKVFTSTEGEKGKVYFGGRFERNGIGGGLAWYDPATDSIDGYSAPFNDYQIISMTSSLDKKYIIISTLGVNTATEGKIFVVSSATNQIVSSFKPTPKASSTGFIVGISNTEAIGISYDKVDNNKAYVYKINILTGEVLATREIGARVAFVNDTNQLTGKALVRDEYGTPWAYLDGTLVKISADLNFQIVGKINDTLGKFSIKENFVYLTGKDMLRRIQYR